jgi:hypothetical protein
MDENSSPSRVPAVLIAVTVLLVLLSAYAGLYFAGTTGMGTVSATGGSVRLYRASWQALLFMPASVVESAVTGREIRTGFVTAVVRTK